MKHLSLPPKISIVTPSYNQAQYLEECIDSILSQGYPNLEYVIMDGGSTDGSVEIIKKYAKHLTYWQSCPDGGQYAAINAGFARTTGEIMAWLNSDDKYHPNALLKAAYIFSAHKEIEWITGRRTIWDVNGKLSLILYFENYSRLKFLQGNWGKPCIQQESTFWKRSLWNKAGAGLNLDCKLAADAELWFRYFRYTEIYQFDTLLSGFRSYGNQRSSLNLKQYIDEGVNIQEDELKLITEDEIFYSMPSPQRISPKKIIEFADKFHIPLTDPGKTTYIDAISEAIINTLPNRLEFTETIHDEIQLWGGCNSPRKKMLYSYLIKLIESKNRAIDLAEEAEKLCRNGNYHEAKKLNDNALAIYPTYKIALNNAGVIDYHFGNYHSAIEYLKKATDTDFGFSQPYKNIAILFNKLSMYDKVEWALSCYMEQTPEDLEMKEFYQRLMSWR